MAIYRVKAHWTGFSGAPGMSVLHYQDFGGDATIEAQRAVDAVRHPFEPLHPATRAGLLEIAEELQPLALRWGK